MKKKFYLIAASFAAIMLSLTFTACGSDDDEESTTTTTPAQTQGQSQSTVIKDSVKFYIEMPSEGLKFADVIVIYYDENGQKQTKTLTDADNKVSVSFEIAKSQDVGFSYEYKRKSNWEELVQQETDAYTKAKEADPNAQEPTYRLDPIYSYEYSHGLSHLSGSQNAGNYPLSLINKGLSINEKESTKSHYATYDAATNSFK